MPDKFGIRALVGSGGFAGAGATGLGSVFAGEPASTEADGGMRSSTAITGATPGVGRVREPSTISGAD